MYPRMFDTNRTSHHDHVALIQSKLCQFLLAGVGLVLVIGKLPWNQRCYRGIFKGVTLRWRHNERDCVSNHQPHYCLLKRLFGRRSRKTSKLRVTGLCEGNSLETGEFPAQRASNAENVSIRWRHHEHRLQYTHTKVTSRHGNLFQITASFMRSLI